MISGRLRHTRKRRAACLLLLLAACYTAFPSVLPGHAFAASATVCTSECDDGSSPSPSPAPLHDQSDCSLCKAGGSAAPATQVARLTLPLRLAALPNDAGIVPPRALHTSPEAARAPPRALFA